MSNVQISVDVQSDRVIITLPRINQPSKSGKTQLIASSGGNIRTTSTVDGKPVTIGVNAYTDR